MKRGGSHEACVALALTSPRLLLQDPGGSWVETPGSLLTAWKKGDEETWGVCCAICYRVSEKYSPPVTPRGTVASCEGSVLNLPIAAQAAPGNGRPSEGCGCDGEASTRPCCFSKSREAAVLHLGRRPLETLVSPSGAPSWVPWPPGGIWANFSPHLKVNHFTPRKGDAGSPAAASLIYEVSGLRGARRVALFYAALYMHNPFYDLFKKATETAIFCPRPAHAGSPQAPHLPSIRPDSADFETEAQGHPGGCALTAGCQAGHPEPERFLGHAAAASKNDLAQCANRWSRGGAGDLGGAVWGNHPNPAGVCSQESLGLRVAP